VLVKQVDDFAQLFLGLDIIRLTEANSFLMR
jgi:hypothetical protein